MRVREPRTQELSAMATTIPRTFLFASSWVGSTRRACCEYDLCLYIIRFRCGRLLCNILLPSVGNASWCSRIPSRTTPFSSFLIFFILHPGRYQLPSLLQNPVV